NDANASKTLDAAEVASAVSGTTDASGNYSFPSLGTGDFIVCEVQQATWFQSRPFNGMTPPTGETVTNSCPTGSTATDTNATYGYAFHMSGADQPGNDFGNFQQGTKSGVKFNDLNADGIKDGGEPGLNGWSIRAYVDSNGDGILGATETTFTSTTTATAGIVVGAYSFSLNPGKYVVCEVLQSGW